MTLQSSGAISLSQINTELGRSSTATISIDSAENGTYSAINITSPSRPNGSRPNSFSEWYSYNHINNEVFYANGSDCLAARTLRAYTSTAALQVNTTIMYIRSGTSMVGISNGNYVVDFIDNSGIVTVSGGNGLITAFTECSGGGGGPQ
jgi:hypothetical protein